jgi:DNA-binding MarR family transcriptional regulator
MSQTRPINNLGYLLQHVTTLLSKQSERVLQERFGIGFSQFKILRVLQFNLHIKQREIASNLGQTEASISRQVKLMLDEGLLHSTISPKNRREHITVPTAKGIKLTQAAMDALAQYHTPTFASLSEKQREQLKVSLEIIHTKICSTDHPNPVAAKTMFEE